MDPLEKLKRDVEIIQARNSRVEADKAWETSLLRKILTLIVTYILASLVMYMIGIPNFYLSSLIPTLGFFLSTLTFSFIKSWWARRYFMTKNSSEAHRDEGKKII